MSTTVHWSNTAPDTPELHIVPLLRGDGSATPAPTLDDPPLQQLLDTLLAQPETCTAQASVALSPPGERRIVTVGIDPRLPGPHQPSAADRVQAIHAAAASLLELLQRMHVSTAQLELSDDPADGELAEHLAAGLALAGFAFTDYRRDAHAEHSHQLTLTASGARAHAAIRRGLEHAYAANHARHLAALPPNVATPEYLADHAGQLADQAGLRCTVYRGKALDREQMIGLTSVGNASEHKPCLIELIYEPADADADVPTLALVGKTITFDSGGLSLKINDTMRYMKYDKAAGTALLGVMSALPRLGPRCRVVALLPAAENAISDVAYRVDDIIRFPNNVSVEVTNTDFEGRLVMADAMIHACAYKPAALIDLGTLTGEIITALGHDTAGLWTQHEPLRQALLSASQRTGERIWPMPLTREHQRAIRSHHADIVNLNLDAPGKPCQCAAFLSHFIDPPELPWAHLDIAGPVHVTTAQPPYTVGPTGFGTRLLLDVIAEFRGFIEL